jgi:hypothetical protein
MSLVFCPNPGCKLLLDDADRSTGRCPRCGRPFGAGSKPGKGANASCVCGIIGLLIALGTIGYALANKDEFLYMDSSGVPAGPLSFAIVCGPPLLLAAILCIVGIVYRGRKP